MRQKKEVPDSFQVRSEVTFARRPWPQSQSNIAFTANQRRINIDGSRNWVFAQKPNHL